MCSACAGDYENPEMTAPDLPGVCPQRGGRSRALERSELVEIRVGPTTITEVYVQYLSEEAMSWEESLRDRSRKAARRSALRRLLLGAAMGAAAMAGLIWLLRGL